MAVVILGGLVTSTLLNLFVVPVLYLTLGRRNEAAVLGSRDSAVEQPGLKSRRIPPARVRSR